MDEYLTHSMEIFDYLIVRLNNNEFHAACHYF